MRKKLSLLLALMLIAALVASCGGKNNSSSQAPSGGESSSGTSSSGGESSDAEEDGYKLPIANGDVELTVWCAMDPSTAQTLENYNDTAAVRAAEAATGVKIKFTHPPSGGEQEQFNILLSSGNMPDIMHYSIKSTPYPGGIDKAIDDELFVDLTPYLDNYMPDYKLALNRNDDTRRQVYTDSGRVGLAWMINNTKEDNWGGILIREDWLTELNLEMPVTYDDWTNVLTKFRDEKGATAPYVTGSQTFFSVLGSLHAGFGISEGFHNENGKVVFGPTDPRYREFLKLMASWYEEGLIDREYTTRDMFDFSVLATGQTGALGFGTYDMPVMLESAMGVKMLAAPYPVQKVGDMGHIGWPRYEIANDGMAVTTSCKTPEIAAQWLNFFYTEEGYVARNYGIEGETFEVVDGERMFTQEIRDEKAAGNISNFTFLGIGFAGLYEHKNNLAGSPIYDTLMNSYKIFTDSNDSAWVMPPVTLTTEEGRAFSNIIGDVNTYVQENTGRFISGLQDINDDAQWEKYLGELENMRIEEATGYQQAALDRYYKR